MKACRPPEQEPIRPTLPVVIGLRAYPLHGGFGIADHLGVGNAALGAHLGGDVVRVAIAASTLALV